MKTLTYRQQQVFNYVREYISSHKYSPSFREIAKAFNITAKGAHDHVRALEKKNCIKRTLNRSRSIEIMEPAENDRGEEFIMVPLLGNVAAGVPLFSEENYETTIKISAVTLPAGRYFALHIQGDSMENAGIMDGDIGVFQHQQTARNGDIVVARINDESVTLKRFYREKNRIKLKAENPIYPPIYTQNVKVLGKLRRIIREYD